MLRDEKQNGLFTRGLKRCRWVFAGLLLGLVAGCDDAAPSSSATNSGASTRPASKFIAFVGAGDMDPIWPVLKNSAERYSTNLGSLEVRYYSPGGSSPQDQIRLVQSLNDRLMGGLCIQVTNADALRSVLEPLHQKGVAIVSMLQPVPINIRAGHVGYDDAEIGRMLADTTAKVLDNRGTVMLLHAGHANPIYGPRLSALEKRLATYPDVEIFAQVDCGMDTLAARRLMRERSERFPRLSAWVAVDDWPLRFLGELDSIIPPNCKFITLGGTPPHWPHIRSGRCPAIVAANYNDLGAQALQFCETAMHAPSRFSTVYHAPLRIVWASYLDDYIDDWTYWSTGKRPEKLPER